MKKLLLLVGALLSINAAQAQYYLVPHPGANANPGILNNDGEYPIGTAGAQTGWTVVHDATTNALVWSPVTTLPASFNFKFNNTAVTGWKASTSGVVTFSTGATAVPPTTPAALPSALIPDNSLCVWGMAPQAADKIAYKMFGSSPNRQLWIQYNSYTTPGTNPAGWTYWSIVLEETTHKIYFVDQKTANGSIALTVGLQINGTTAFQLPASPAVATLAGNGGTPADNSYYEFVYGTQPAYDLEMKVVNIPPKVALMRAPFDISGTLLSNGASTVTSFNLNYKVNNNAVVTAPITNVSIASNGSYKFTHPVKWNPGANGSYDMKVWASNINGNNADLNHANDTAYVSVVVEQSPRTVLHEVFTSATCGPCLGGNNNLHAIMRNKPGVAINIKYQQNFPAPSDDPYQTTESISRRSYYSITSIPHMKPDGGINFGAASLWSGGAFNANYYTPQLMEQYSAIPATILVDGVYSINPADSTVTATATITPFGNVSSSNLVLHSVITERHTVKNVRTNGETEFFDVVKKMMPDVNGMPIPALVSGQPVNYTQSFAMSHANYTVPFSKYLATKPNRPEHIDSLRVVFFVQDKITKEVFNAGIGKRVAFVLGTSEKANALNLTVYPNPTTGVVKVAYTPKAGEKAAVTVYNMLGAKVFDKALTTDSGQMNVDLSDQAAGFYLLNFQMGDKVITKKVSLVK